MASELEKLMAMGSMAAGGGYAQAALGGAQALYGLSQLPKARAEFERAKAAAPSLETPSQFYENYKNAYDATLAGMQSDAIQANLATSVQALQGAGGRALVGGLSQATAQSQMAQNQMLAQERQMRLAAGQQLAAAEERTIGRKEQRSQQQQAYANQAYQAALGNIGAGLGAVGEGLMYSGGLDFKGDGKLAEKAGEAADKAASKVKEGVGKIGDKISDMRDSRKVRKFGDFVEESRSMIGEAAKPDILKTPKVNMPDPTGMFMKNKPLQQADKMPNLQYVEPFGINDVEPEKGFFDLDPVKGSVIPKEFQNEQALKQLDALGKMYDNAAPALNSLLPVQPQNPISYQQIPIVNEYLPLLRTQAFFRHGGMMTDGAFSHKSNPIDIVQEGHKVGEMTGGEYIINPTQAKRIAKESSYARKLFKRFEKNAKNNK